MDELAIVSELPGVEVASGELFAVATPTDRLVDIFAAYSLDPDHFVKVDSRHVVLVEELLIWRNSSLPIPRS
jgi:hypothetical protein